MRLPDGMSVVKSNQPVATRAVQRQRVVQPMRPLGGTSDTADREPNPVLALQIDNKYLAVKIQQHVCARIPIMPFHRSKVIIY
jgi:hypothetical protein